MIDSGLVLGAATMVAWSACNVMTKRVAKSGAYMTSLLIIIGSSIPIAIPLLFTLSGISAAGIVIAGLSGIAMVLGNLLFYKALETQQASNSYGMTVVQSILIGLFGVVLLGNQLTPLEILGAGIGVVGVLMVAMHGRLRLNRMLLPAITGNAVWAVGWGLAAYAIKYYANTFMILGICRVAGILGMLIIYKKSAPKPAMPGLQPREWNAVLAIGLGAGVLSGIGSIALGSLALSSNFAIGGILTSFVPVLVAIAAYFVYRERLTRTQMLGILVATAGAAVIVL
jgi:drug/metabolite transporter (DMT)-like permease